MGESGGAVTCTLPYLDICRPYRAFPPPPPPPLHRREEAIRAIEDEIRRERRVADEVVQAMPAAKQEKYFSMTTANEELLQVLLHRILFWYHVVASLHL